MSRIAYVNGRFVPFAEASVHVEDRGFQFADGVYEVWSVRGGRLNDADGHFDRLDRSLGELSIDPPMSRGALKVVLKETIRRNRIRDGLLYLQVTRGQPSLRQRPRDSTFPDPWTPPSVVATARSVSPVAAEARADQGIAVITTPETRWARCDIKTVGLLPNLLAKQKAKDAGATEHNERGFRVLRQYRAKIRHCDSAFTDEVRKIVVGGHDDGVTAVARDRISLFLERLECLWEDLSQDDAHPARTGHREVRAAV